MWQRRLLTLGMVVMVTFGTARPGRTDVRLAELRLERQGMFTALVIPVPGRALCNHFTEEPKDGKPFRVVLDLCGAVHRLEQKTFGGLPSTMVTRIRTSQYATAPQNVVRVVLDLASETTYKVATDENTITISLVAPNEPQFAPWSAAAEPMPAQAASAARPTVGDAHSKNSEPGPSPVVTANSIAPAAPAVKQETKNKPAASTKDRPAQPAAVRLPAEEDEITARPEPTVTISRAETKASSPQTQAVPATAPHTVTAAPTPMSAKETTVLGPLPPRTISGTTAATTETPQQIATPPLADKPVAMPPVPFEQTTRTTGSSSTLVPAIRQYDSPAGPPWPNGETATHAATEQPVMPPVQNAPPRVAPLADTSAPSEPAVATVTEPTIKAQQEEKIPLLVRLRKKFVGGPGEEKATVDAHADSVALARIRALATLAQFSPKDSSMISGRQTGIIDRAELERKIASVEPSAVPPGSTLAETEGRPTGEAAATEEGERGSPVQLEMDREEIRYDPGDTRDPFKALVEGQRSGLWTSALPRVDALRLVGILQDYDGAIALFEDMEGYGYILREGDQVKDGFLLTIGTNRAVFQIDEYGWVHTVALEMREDGSKSKHGYTTKPQEE